MMTSPRYTFLLILVCIAFSFSQPLTTDSASAPAVVGDTAAVADSTAAQAPSPEAEPQPDQPSLDTAAAQQPFSLFSYPRIFSIGVSLSWLYYSEDIDLSDLRASFFNYFGREPQISGAPKSDEYGLVLGLSLGETFYHWKNKVVVRPKASLLVGFNNTYDGSLQQQLTINGAGDTTGYEFDPYRFNKTNVFFHAGCDIGYAFPYFALPGFVYTGLDAKVWYRDLMDKQGELYYSPDVSNWELYYWFSLPLGIDVAAHAGPNSLLGVDACVNVMFYGGMQAGLSSGGSSVNFPPVTLGNRASVKVELFAEKRRENRPALRFAPYFLFYTFGRSNTATAQANDGNSAQFYEPSSRSFLFGFTLSWEYLGRKVN
jgi:hypothetical protein